MSAIQELYDKLCGDIGRMADERNKDIDRITETENDWEYRDHAVRVRSARFICESSHLEQQRISVRRELCRIAEANSIVLEATDVN